MIIEAIYQSGVLKPLVPLPYIMENQKVRLIVEPVNLIEYQRKHRIHIPPDVAREIADSAYEDLWELPDDVT